MKEERGNIKVRGDKPERQERGKKEREDKMEGRGEKRKGKERERTNRRE